jgi:phospholipase/lecithinase/hemolysin
MRNSLKKLSTLLGAAALSVSASAYDNVYFFGDSLSDAGQFTSQFAGAFPPGIEAKFTNIDPLTGNIIAADVIANAYGFSSVDSGLVEGLLGAGIIQDIGNNYAVGGAVAIDADSNPLTPDFNLPTQVFSHLSSRAGQADSGALYTIIIGGNDLFAAQEIRSAYVFTEPGAERQAIRQAAKARVDAAVDSVEAQLMTLIGAGAQNVLVGNAPDVGVVPATDLLVDGLLAAATTPGEERRASRMYEISTKLTGRYNRKLKRAVKRVSKATGVDVILYDVEEFLNTTIDNASDLGYTNTTDACLASTPNVGACEGFIFADGVHPTTVVHQAIGFDLVQTLNAQ